MRVPRRHPAFFVSDRRSQGLGKDGLGKDGGNQDGLIHFGHLCSLQVTYLLGACYAGGNFPGDYRDGPIFAI